jgi:hypothetical protein
MHIRPTSKKAVTKVQANVTIYLYNVQANVVYHHCGNQRYSILSAQKVLAPI